MARVLVTGYSGCIGAATVAYLAGRGAEVVGLSRGGGAGGGRGAPGLVEVAGDVTDGPRLEAVFREFRPTHLVHLAAWQTPECEAQPLGGMAVNLGGTATVFQVARDVLGDHLQRVVFASSAAVYGPRDRYPGPSVRPGDLLLPVNLYGYWKVAGEGCARAFQRETGVPTLALRLATTYGPGRDRGLTSAPTTAAKAVALGMPYEVPYQGREHYHFVGDVAAGFGGCALDPFEGFGAFNLRGQTVPTAEFLDLLRSVAGRLGLGAGVGVGIAEGAPVQPFACDLDDTDLTAAFPEMPLTPLEDGIAMTLEAFREDAAAGRLTRDEVAAAG